MTNRAGQRPIAYRLPSNLVRRFLAVGTMQAIVVVEMPPFGQLPFEIDVISMGQQLVELVVVGSVDIQIPYAIVNLGHGKMVRLDPKLHTEKSTNLGNHDR